MALGVYFSVEGMSRDKYDEVLRRLEAAGQGAPKGRLYHASFGPPERLQVFDVWDSPETFQAFGAVLMPILGELGIDPGQPNVEPFVDLSHLAERVPDELLKTNFVEAPLGDEGSLLEEGVVHHPVATDDPRVAIECARTLEARGAFHKQTLPFGGAEDGVGVAVDVHKARVGKYLQEQPDPARMRRRLQD